jgi:hypothetical protein
MTPFTDSEYMLTVFLERNLIKIFNFLGFFPKKVKFRKMTPGSKKNFEKNL